MLNKSTLLMQAIDDGSEAISLGYMLGDEFFPVKKLKLKEGVLSVSSSQNLQDVSSIASESLYGTFIDCVGITSVRFPALMNIGKYGLGEAFSGCTGLTGSVSFPALISVSSGGLYRAFSGCTNLTEVHFPAALSGNSQCTASNMGCSNATVYFDL